VERRRADARNTHPVLEYNSRLSRLSVLALPTNHSLASLTLRCCPPCAAMPPQWVASEKRIEGHEARLAALVCPSRP